MLFSGVILKTTSLQLIISLQYIVGGWSVINLHLCQWIAYHKSDSFGLHRFNSTLDMLCFTRWLLKWDVGHPGGRGERLADHPKDVLLLSTRQFSYQPTSSIGHTNLFCHHYDTHGLCDNCGAASGLQH